MLKIIADEKIPFLHGVLEPYADVIYLPGNMISRESVMNADALLIRTRTICNKSLLEGTSVKFIATATIGFDHIDTDFCKLNNITWTNAPGCNSSSVQQYISAALLMLAHSQKFSLSDKTLGIVGVGNVGYKVWEVAKVLGMKVKLNDPPRVRAENITGFVALDEILETCEIITLHVPLNKDGKDKTYHLFDGKLFGKLKKGTWLINSSRGEVVDTKALNSALSSAMLDGAILDVWENEPYINLELLRQVYITTPHIAGYSMDGKANGTSQVVQKLSCYFGLPLRDFYPQNIPAPAIPGIVIDGAGRSAFDIVDEAILYTYPIMEDHQLLQRSPETFEWQRGHYPLRREYTAYTVILRNGNPEAIDMLEKLGFKVKTN
jgi:erythronate-4-phosphate dehydrogenase